jgi:hypothetical protein
VSSYPAVGCPVIVSADQDGLPAGLTVAVRLADLVSPVGSGAPLEAGDRSALAVAGHGADPGGRACGVPEGGGGRAGGGDRVGARVLAARLYGVGPVTALAMTCWLGGAGRFSSSRKAVRFAGLDITVCSCDSRRSPGRLSRQGPEVLRWAVHEAGKVHARASAPDHACYARVKDRKDGKRAALSEARKLLRQACHILAGLGGDALGAA